MVKNKLQQLATLMRLWSLKMTGQAGSGHPSSALSAADLMAGLVFGSDFRYDVKKPGNPNNDRLIFSKGHASPLFYSIWAAAGALTPKELLTYRQFTSALEGHPSMDFRFTEAATGSLGQGLSIGVGTALNAKYLDTVPYKTYVLLGDSEMAEGSQWEAMMLAAHYKLNNLIGIIDVNRLGQRGATMYGHDISQYVRKIKAFGWQTITIDGHDMDQIVVAFKKAQAAKTKPVMIIAKTLKGKGVSVMENKNGFHGKALSGNDLQQALAELGPVDQNLRGTIRAPKNATPKKEKAKPSSGGVPISKPISTRKAYGYALARVGGQRGDIISLDAEVSNSTYAEIFAAQYPKRFFEMFIAEQNMVGVALGLSRRGKKPFVSTFAAFLTRAFDQIRMSQYSDANIVFVGSHAGVSIGEDGPSQMALEDIAMFRSLRDSVVLYPADGVATDKLVTQMARYNGISYLRTTRMDTPILYKRSESFEIGGSKTLRRSAKDKATVVAAGVTLHEALAAADELQKSKINIRVIDLYSIKPLDTAVLRKAAVETGAIIAVEDHYPDGGLGDAVTKAITGYKVVFKSLAVTKKPKSGKPAQLLDFENISRKAIVRTVKMLISKSETRSN